MIVTLLTDFGTEDYFVGAMKGAILSRDPRIRIVDITHHVPPHDIAAAAFLLSACYHDFPGGTVHLVVVDPGVGSARRAIAVRAGGFHFVGPDNGVFDFVFAREEYEARQIEDPALRAADVSFTFHGRDVFAPAAAALAAGHPFDDIGRAIDPTRLPTAPVRARDGGLEGRIIHVDHFGNCVTSFRPSDLPGGPAAYRFAGTGWTIDAMRAYYADGPPGEAFLIVGSAGYLEIAIDRGSAAAALALSRNDAVRALPRS